jgi:flagellar hook-basal body complex protein FliE
MEPIRMDSEGVRALAGSHRPPPLGQPVQGQDFKQMLGKYLAEVNALQLEADKAVRDLATGKVENFHEVIVAMSEADLSFRLMMEMRNKLVEAYKEIMRMQV